MFFLSDGQIVPLTADNEEHVREASEEVRRTKGERSVI